MTRASDTARLLGAGATILDGTTISTADNTAQLTLTSTDADASSGPNILLKRDSASPADNDTVGRVKFVFDNDAGEETEAVRIDAFIPDVSDGTEDATFQELTMVGGTMRSRVEHSSTETVFNQDSVDVDFRVESNGNANMLFVDGGNNTVHIGQSAPDTTLSGGTPPFQITGSGFSATSAIVRREASSFGPSLMLAKSRNTAVGSHTIVQSGDRLGGIIFIGDDGTDLDTYGATITADCDGTPGANDMPGRLVFSTTADGANSPTERCRIDSSGRLLIGATSNTTARLVSVADLSAMHTCTFQNSANNTNGIFLRQQNHAGQDCGNITQTGSTTVSYGTSSDYRLKENVSYDFDATTRLKQLKPARFNFIADGTDKVVDGFLAHEAQTVIPESVVGEKDATETLKNVVLLANDIGIVASDITEAEWTQGKTDGIYASDTSWTASKTIPKYQQIDQSKIVPLLVKTIQELEARITTLENA